MPSRWASALASPRVRTPSLRRIAETWWPTVFSERNSRSAMSALRRPCADEREHLDLARGEPGGVLPRRGRGPRGSPRTPRSRRRRRDDRRRGLGAEALQLVEGRAAGAVVVGAGEGERGLVGAAQVRPELRRALAGRRPARPRRARRRRPAIVLGDPGAAAPAGELADRPRRLPAQRRARARPRSPPPPARGAPSSHAASARAAATGPSRCSSPRRLGQRERLVEQRPHVGIAAPGPHQARAP